MKRLVDIASIEEVTTCFRQQNGYKAQVKALSDYNKSLGYYKVLVKEIKSKTAKFSEDIQGLLVFKKNKAKKRTVIDYYTILLENLMGILVQQSKKVVDLLNLTYVQAKEFYRKTQKMLLDSKKMMQQQIDYHQKVFKQYMVSVYPETTSILFRFQGDKKLVKKQDPSKEASLIQLYRAYDEVLNHEIDRINEKIREMTDTFKQSTQDLKFVYVTWLQTCLPQFQGEMREQELISFAHKLQAKDKSERSRSKSHHRSNDF